MGIPSFGGGKVSFRNSLALISEDKTYLSAFLEDIAISLIVIARSPRLAVHVRNILWLFIKLKRGQAWFVLSGLFATKFTSFCR